MDDNLDYTTSQILSCLIRLLGGQISVIGIKICE